MTVRLSSIKDMQKCVFSLRKMEVNLLTSCTRMTSFYFLPKEKKIKVGVTPKKLLFWLNLKWTFSMPTTSRVLRMFSWMCFEWFKCLNLLFFFFFPCLMCLFWFWDGPAPLGEFRAGCWAVGEAMRTQARQCRQAQCGSWRVQAPRK